MQKLLRKYIQGDATEVEKAQVLTWLDEDPDHVREYMALRKLYAIEVWHGGDVQKESTGSGHNPLIHENNVKRLFLSLTKIAAIILLTLGIAYYFNHKKEEVVAYQTLSIPAGQRAELTLADGTHVWLNAKSTLRFPQKFDPKCRRVELEGEGYFEVVHDVNHPFIVSVNDFNVQVLGTEFNVRAYDKKTFETTLLTGSVLITSSRMKGNVKLNPNETVSLKGGKLELGKISDPNYYRWREGLLCFDNETIGDLFEKFKRYYDVQIIVQRTELLTHRYTGKFRIQDGVEHALRVLQLKHRFSYTKNDDRNEIVIK